MYSFGDNYKSDTMCILGRAITGLGGPRLINRRYVAGATPSTLHTSVNAYSSVPLVAVVGTDNLTLYFLISIFFQQSGRSAGDIFITSMGYKKCSKFDKFIIFFLFTHDLDDSPGLAISRDNGFISITHLLDIIKV